MIEEQVDFLKALEYVVAWVERHSNWQETLLIVTADHECGMLWGPDSHRVAFDPIVDQGPGTMPRMRHNFDYHTNSLVPLYARGAGSEAFQAMIVGTDATAAAVWKTSGKYVDNASVFTVMNRAILASPAAPAKTPAAMPRAAASEKHPEGVSEGRAHLRPLSSGTFVRKR